MPLLMWLQRKLVAKELLVLIQEFLGGHLRKGYSLCWKGTNHNCRCHRCQRPARSEEEPIEKDDDILKHRGRKGPRRRVKAARWIHFLSGAVALSGNHGTLHGMLIAAECGRGPLARSLRSRSLWRYAGGISRWTPWVWRWIIAIFLQYVRDHHPNLEFW